MQQIKAMAQPSLPPLPCGPAGTMAMQVSMANGDAVELLTLARRWSKHRQYKLHRKAPSPVLINSLYLFLKQLFTWLWQKQLAWPWDSEWLCNPNAHHELTVIWFTDHKTKHKQQHFTKKEKQKQKKNGLLVYGIGPEHISQLLMVLHPLLFPPTLSHIYASRCISNTSWQKSNKCRSG